MNIQYLVSICDDRKPFTETIHHLASKLKIGVTEADENGFEPQQGEVHYFVSCKKSNICLAFETMGYSRAHKKMLILTIIAQYCAYLGFIDAQIHATLPVL